MNEFGSNPKTPNGARPEQPLQSLSYLSASVATHNPPSFPAKPITGVTLPDILPGGIFFSGRFTRNPLETLVGAKDSNLLNTLIESRRCELNQIKGDC